MQRIISFQKEIKFLSYIEFWEYISEEERILTDVLRQLILQHLPTHCKEKLVNNVPYFFGKRRICFIWPGSIPGGGFRKGVMLGFSFGNKLPDLENYLTHGTNKRIFYKIYNSVEELNEVPIVALLNEAIVVDSLYK